MTTGGAVWNRPGRRRSGQGTRAVILTGAAGTIPALAFTLRSACSARSWQSEPAKPSGTPNGGYLKSSVDNAWWAGISAAKTCLRRSHDRGRDRLIAAGLTRIRVVCPLKAGPGGRTGRDGAVPGGRRTIRRGRYQAAGHELRCLPAACECGRWRRGPSGQRRGPCPSWIRTIAATTGIRNARSARSPGAVLCTRQHQPPTAPTGAGQELEAHAAELVQQAGAGQERPAATAAVTAATATTPLQIMCPRRSPGPAAVTEKTPKNGLEITSGYVRSDRDERR
jgi:hypothetical protein